MKNSSRGFFYFITSLIEISRTVTVGFLPSVSFHFNVKNTFGQIDPILIIHLAVRKKQLTLCPKEFEHAQ